MIVIYFLKSQLTERMIKLNFCIIPKTNEEHFSVIYGCTRFIDSYRFLSSRLVSLVETLVDISRKTHEKLREKMLVMVIL